MRKLYCENAANPGSIAIFMVRVLWHSGELTHPIKSRSRLFMGRIVLLIDIANLKNVLFSI